MKKIQIPTGTGTLFFDPHEIICLKAERSYTKVYVVDEKSKKGWSDIFTSYNLKYFQNKLPPYHFRRVSKSYIVGIKHLTVIGRDHSVTLKFSCCNSIKMSRAYCKTLPGK